jgi:hypothetical protein
MLYDNMVMKAVSRIKQRSEKQSDLDIVRKTFVDPGVIDELDNDNNQVIYGRRGTGKTHLFRMFQSDLGKRENTTVCYIDCRMLGSSSQVSDENLSIEHRSFSLFRDILSEAGAVLLEYIVEMSPEDSAKALEQLDSFYDAFSQPQTSSEKATLSTSNKDGSTSNKSAGIGLAIAGKIGIDLATKKSADLESINTISLELRFSDKAFFNKIFHAIDDMLNIINGDLYLLLDEWSSVPAMVQPYVAEYIKKSFFPSNRVILKIAAIQNRSHFMLHTLNGPIGFELGADISSAPSLDSFYGFEERGEELRREFAEMIYRHISSALPVGYLRKHHHVYDGLTLMDCMFDHDGFNSLALASEGVIRDLINIFTIALSKVHRPKSYERRTKITKIVIYESAKQWFDRDKFKNLDSRQKECYMKVIREAVHRHKSRYFAIPCEYADLPALNSLIDLRVLHQAATSYASLVGNMETYNIYNIDFGSYATLLILDSRSKYQEIPFFDRNTFSKFPDQRESMEQYLIDMAVFY